MRSAPNFGDLLLDRRPSHFVPPEMRERMLLDLPSASGSGPARSFAMASLAQTRDRFSWETPLYKLAQPAGRRRRGSAQRNKLKHAIH